MKNALFRRIEKVNPKLNKEETNSMIIFSRTKEGNLTSIEKIEEHLNPIYGDLIEIYHSKLDLLIKESAQDNFVNNKNQY